MQFTLMFKFADLKFHGASIYIYRYGDACYRLDFIDKSMGSFCTYKLTLVADCGDIVAVVELAGGGGVIIHTPYL